MQNALYRGIVSIGMTLGLAWYSQPANAQSIGPVSIEMEGWAYVPVLADTDQSVEAIVALRINDPDAAISALYCERDAAGNWRAEAWGDVPMEEVAASIFDSLGAELEDGTLEEMYDAWPIDLDQALLLDAMSAPIGPVAFGDGVALGDPFEQIVQTYPQILDPLEQTGYPAVATLSGNAVTGGTFTSNPISPQPIDDCLRASELLDALFVGFEASAIDGVVVDAAFAAASLAINGNCACRVRITNTYTPWVYTCGTWTMTSGPNQNGTTCHYSFQRSVSGTRSRTRTKTFSNCTTAVCNQVCSKTGTQTGGTTVVIGIGGTCPTSATPPAGVTCRCGFFSCSTGPWTPPCPF